MRAIAANSIIIHTKKIAEARGLIFNSFIEINHVKMCLTKCTNIHNNRCLMYNCEFEVRG